MEFLMLALQYKRRCVHCGNIGRPELLGKYSVIGFVFWGVLLTSFFVPVLFSLTFLLLFWMLFTRQVVCQFCGKELLTFEQVRATYKDAREDDDEVAQNPNDVNTSVNNGLVHKEKCTLDDCYINEIVQRIDRLSETLGAAEKVTIYHGFKKGERMPFEDVERQLALVSRTGSQIQNELIEHQSSKNDLGNLVDLCLMYVNRLVENTNNLRVITEKLKQSSGGGKRYGFFQFRKDTKEWDRNTKKLINVRSNVELFLRNMMKSPSAQAFEYCHSTNKSSTSKEKSRTQRRRLHSPVAELVRQTIDIQAHLEKFGANEPDAALSFNRKQFNEYAAGIMWNCSLNIFDRISDDEFLVEEFSFCNGNLLFIECAIFPSLAIISLTQNGYLDTLSDSSPSVEFEGFYEVLEIITSNLETYYDSFKEDLPEFQQQRVEHYFFIEDAVDWFKAICSMFYMVFRARSLEDTSNISSELVLVQPELEGRFGIWTAVQNIAESELNSALEKLKLVIYEYSEDDGFTEDHDPVAEALLDEIGEISENDIKVAFNEIQNQLMEEDEFSHYKYNDKPVSLSSYNQAILHNISYSQYKDTLSSLKSNDEHFKRLQYETIRSSFELGKSYKDVCSLLINAIKHTQLNYKDGIEYLESINKALIEDIGSKN